jgi:hypothetical protein
MQPLAALNTAQTKPTAQVNRIQSPTPTVRPPCPHVVPQSVESSSSDASSAETAGQSGLAQRCEGHAGWSHHHACAVAAMAQAQGIARQAARPCSTQCRC